MLIYIITNDVNDKVYIGQTTKTLEERILGHKSAFASNLDMHIYNAMHKYGWDKFHFRVLDDSPTTQEELDNLEQYYINKYDSISNGYNMIAGGVGANPMFYEKARVKHDNKMRDPEVRAKISASMKESYAKRGGPTEEHRKNLSKNKKELYSSAKGDEVRAKFRASYKFTPEHQEAMLSKHRKAVYCVDIDDIKVAEFDQVKDAAEWWYDQGYVVKDKYDLSNRIKESAKENKYIRGLKWIYVSK